MIEITFLGTSSMQPTKNRNHSGILLSYKKENILFDCGEGIQRQMRTAGIKPAKITRLFISHWHGDHVFGIPGLMSTMGCDKPDKTLKIYGPEGTKKYFNHLFKSFAKKDIIEHEIYEVKARKVLETEDFVIEAQPLKHSTPCLGYSFIEKERRKINLSKARKLGIKEGPIMRQLQLGKTISLKGKKIKAAQVTTLVPGKKVSYVADTVLCKGAELLARDADLLISEGTHLAEIKEKAGKYKHLTVKEAALLASENGAKRLIITHLSQRYKHVSEMRAEAKEYFPNSEVAEDFMKVKV